MSIYDRIFELAACVELALVLAQAIWRQRYLPLGGGHVQQVGIVFGGAFLVSKVFKEVALAVSLFPIASYVARFVMYASIDLSY